MQKSHDTVAAGKKLFQRNGVYQSKEDAHYEMEQQKCSGTLKSIHGLGRYVFVSVSYLSIGETK